MSFMRKYILFKNPVWKQSKNLGFLCSRPRCVRKDSNAALGRGVYAIEVGCCGLKSDSYFCSPLIVSQFLRHRSSYYSVSECAHNV